MLTRRGLLGAAGAAALASSGCTASKPSTPRASLGMGFTVVARVGARAAYTRDLAELRATGASWIRLGIQAYELGGWFGGRWYWDEPAVDYFSDCIRQARTAGLRISLTLAAMADSQDWSFEHYLLVNRLYWARCAALALGAGGVDLVQIYNEHDDRNFRSQQPLTRGPGAGYLQDLARALELARAEFRSVLPGVLTTTAVGGTGLHESTGQRWKRFYDVVAPSVDVIGVNCYPGHLVDQIDRLPSVLGMLPERYAKPFVITEIGIPTEVGGAVSPDTATQVLPLMLQRAAEAGPLAVLVYQLRNAGPRARDPEHNFGILTADHRRRPTYAAVVGAVRRHQR